MIDFNQKAKEWDLDPFKVERARVIAAEIRKQVEFTANMTAFEYGCGTGLLSIALQPYIAQMTLADSSDGMLSVLKAKIAAQGIANMTPVRLDLAADPWPSERYQLIYTLLTLHHVLDIENILRAFYTLLEPEGFLCLADLDKEDGSFHGPDFSGHNGFDREELQEQMARVGFQNIRATTVYTITKMFASGAKTYPIFLMIGEKRG